MTENPLTNPDPPNVTTVTFPTTAEMNIKFPIDSPFPGSADNIEIPSFFNVEQPFKQLAAYPSLLYTETLTVGEDIKSCILQKIQPIITLLNQMEGVFDSALISYQKSVNVKNPEKDWGDRIKALFREYTIFFWKLLLEAVSSIIPFELLDVPLPLLSENTVGDMFTADGRASIQLNISLKIDALIALIPEPFKSMYKNNDIDCPEYKAKTIFEYISDKVCNLFIEAGKTALTAIVDAIEVLIYPVTLEDLSLGLPDFSSLPPDAGGLMDQAEKAIEAAKNQVLGMLFTILPVPPNVPPEDLTLRMVIDYNVTQLGETFENLLITIGDATFNTVILPGPIFGENGFTIGDVINVDIRAILDNKPSELSDIIQIYPIKPFEILLEIMVFPPFPPFFPDGLRLKDLTGMSLSGEMSNSNFFSTEVMKNKLKQLAPISLLMTTGKLMMFWLEQILGYLEDLGVALIAPLKIPFTMTDLLDFLFTPIGGWPPTPPDLSTPCQ